MIANNKAWKSAEPSAENGWSRSSLQDSTQGALGFVLAALASGAVLLANTFSHTHALALDLLGRNPTTKT